MLMSRRRLVLLVLTTKIVGKGVEREGPFPC